MGIGDIETLVTCDIIWHVRKIGIWLDHHEILSSFSCLCICVYIYSFYRTFILHAWHGIARDFVNWIIRGRFSFRDAIKGELARSMSSKWWIAHERPRGSLSLSLSLFPSLEQVKLRLGQCSRFSKLKHVSRRQIGIGPGHPI